MFDPGSKGLPEIKIEQSLLLTNLGDFLHITKFGEGTRVLNACAKPPMQAGYALRADRSTRIDSAAVLAVRGCTIIMRGCTIIMRGCTIIVRGCTIIVRGGTIIVGGGTIIVHGGTFIGTARAQFPESVEAYRAHSVGRLPRGGAGAPCPRGSAAGAAR